MLMVHSKRSALQEACGDGLGGPRATSEWLPEANLGDLYANAPLMPVRQVDKTRRLVNFSLVPTDQQYSAWPHPSPMPKVDCASTANDESTGEKSIILCPGHATRVTLRIIWCSLTRSAIATRAIYWPPNCISIDGC
jgi:hypothetical protein